MLTSSIAEQVNVSDAVSQVVKVLTASAVLPLYTSADRFGEMSSRFVSWHSAQSVTRRIRLSIDLS